MDAWQVPHRDRVRLNALSVSCDQAAVVLERPQWRQRIACDDSATAARVGGFLQWLRLPGDAREPLPDAGWEDAGIEPDLLQWLDAHAWLALEDAGDARTLLAAQAHSIRDRVERAVAALLADLPDGKRGALAAALDTTLRWDERLQHPLREARDDATVELAALRMSQAYYFRNAPMVHAALRVASAVALERLDGDTAGDGLDDLPQAYGETDPVALEIALTQWRSYLQRAATAPRALCSALLRPEDLQLALAPGTGAQFIHEVECFADAVIERLGGNAYLDRLNTASADDPLLAGLAIEEFHVTRRFVEIIAPMLSKRLPSALRALMFRYYAEEVGHEAFEEDTCIAYGIDRDALHASLPLPSHATFVDAFTLVAQSQPVAFLCAVMVTEGLFSRPSPLAERVQALTADLEAVQAVCSRHNDLNACLHHDTITRHALSAIEALSADEKNDALRTMGLLLEINARTWEDLADFYGASPQLALHGFLGQRVGHARGRSAADTGV
jgi:pyrroloquinoline quinone (PQQ) biosynthesis protein C